MIPTSKEIRFETSTYCNYKCPICPREKFTRKQMVMSLDNFKFALDKITAETKQYDTVTFSGYGEALTDPTLIEKMKYAKEKGFKILLLTNGSLLTDKLIKELAGLVENIRVSFYGTTPRAYAEAHGVNNFEYLKNLILKNKNKLKWIMNWIEIPAINNRQNRLWREMWEGKVYGIEMWRPHNWGDLRKYRFIGKRKQTCGRPFTTPLQVQVDLSIVMCCFDVNNNLEIGNLKTQSLEEIFSHNNRKYMRIVRYHQGKSEDLAILCKNCDQLNKDKSLALIYSSFAPKEKRINQVSTTYEKLT